MREIINEKMKERYAQSESAAILKKTVQLLDEGGKDNSYRSLVQSIEDLSRIRSNLIEEMDETLCACLKEVLAKFDEEIEISVRRMKAYISLSKRAPSYRLNKHDFVSVPSSIMTVDFKNETINIEEHKEEFVVADEYNKAWIKVLQGEIDQRNKELVDRFEKDKGIIHIVKEINKVILDLNGKPNKHYIKTVISAPLLRSSRKELKRIYKQLRWDYEARIKSRKDDQQKYVQTDYLKIHENISDLQERIYRRLMTLHFKRIGTKLLPEEQEERDREVLVE